MMDGERRPASNVVELTQSSRLHTDSARYVGIATSVGPRSMASLVGLQRRTRQCLTTFGGVVKKKIRDLDDLVTVPDADDMEDETFIKHLEKRHAEECKIEGYIARYSVHVWINMYRIYHERLHALGTPGQHDHEHEEY